MELYVIDNNNIDNNDNIIHICVGGQTFTTNNVELQLILSSDSKLYVGSNVLPRASTCFSNLS